MSVRLGPIVVAGVMVLVSTFSAFGVGTPAAQLQGVAGKVVDLKSRQLVEWHNTNLIKVTVHFHLTLANAKTQDGTVELDGGQTLQDKKTKHSTPISKVEIKSVDRAG